jgi:hypothetical protein
MLDSLTAEQKLTVIEDIDASMPEAPVITGLDDLEGRYLRFLLTCMRSVLVFEKASLEGAS